MILTKEFARQGNWLFRWRSYLPLILLPFLLMVLKHNEYIKQTGSETSENIFVILCVTISFLGLLIRCITVGYVTEGSSGINTKSQKADVLNTTGIYSIVRHPLYIGNFIIFLGISMFPHLWWFTFLTVLIFWFYYERIVVTEEEFLQKKFGEVFLEWAEKTPAFIPNFKNFDKLSQSFSFKKVFKREYSGFFAIIASYTFLHFAKEILTNQKLVFAIGWVIFFLTGLFVYLTVLILKKNTKIFKS
jgi:protein-S-isoprenylcysteine O-methyltransferase Ste14